jgi:hypothetical protein
VSAGRNLGVCWILSHWFAFSTHIGVRSADSASIALGSNGCNGIQVAGLWLLEKASPAPEGPLDKRDAS